jgi:hypothetical protein
VIREHGLESSVNKLGGIAVRMYDVVFGTAGSIYVFNDLRFYTQKLSYLINHFSDSNWLSLSYIIRKRGYIMETWLGIWQGK